MYPLNQSIMLPEKEEPYILLRGGRPVGFYPSYTSAARDANTKYPGSFCELKPVGGDVQAVMFNGCSNYGRPPSD